MIRLLQGEGLSPRERNRRRVAAAIWALAGYPGYVLCFFAHTCGEGHGAHPPYPVWQVVSDGAWIVAFVVAAALALRSNMRGRLAFCVLLGCLPVSRLVFGSGGGMLSVYGELPAMIVVGAIGVRALLGGARAPAGICASCGYNLTGNVSGVCPECGLALLGQMTVSDTLIPSDHVTK